MHMRHKKWARPELAACPYFLDAPKELRNHWRSRFDRDQALHLELGCGKGVSTAQMVCENRDTNFVAIDITCDILGDARRNMAKAFAPSEPDNALIVRYDIEYIDELFGPEDRVDRIYIHFCNPWTKRPKYAKRRLTHPRQLLQYRTFMAPGAEIWFKTDNDELFEDSLQYFEVSGFSCRYLTRDLHQSGFGPNYISEHEQKYSQLGVPIKMGVFVMEDRPVTIDPVRWNLRKQRREETESGEELP
ncbi:MAG: tRNA (guanosine(46)-N7)-methyltransferase TrmB [Clostridia bacterium]|nr:tRNA (guanosine(46)-N7)-methyltransferase TrmB [Clostridia bacterium]